MLKLDTIDRKILAALQDNGRLSNVELAERVGLSPSPCLRRVRQLADAGLISRYVALLNQNAVGLPVSVFITIKLERQRESDLDRCEAEFGTNPEVVEGYLMTGTRDYLLRVATRDLAAYERLLKTKRTRVDNVASIESSFALKQVKYTSSLPLETLGG